MPILILVLKGITYYQAKIITKDLCDGALWVSTLMSSISSLETTKESLLVFQTRFNLHFYFLYAPKEGLTYTFFFLYARKQGLTCTFLFILQCIVTNHFPLPTLECPLYVPYPRGSHISPWKDHHMDLCGGGALGVSTQISFTSFWVGGGNSSFAQCICVLFAVIWIAKKKLFFCCPNMNFKNSLGLLLFISTLWIWWLTDLVLLMESVQ